MHNYLLPFLRRAVNCHLMKSFFNQSMFADFKIEVDSFQELPEYERAIKKSFLMIFLLN